MNEVIIPDEAQDTVARYLALADEALPRRIEGLYLTGSIALDDYRPGTSDVDFVAVTGAPLLPHELDRLEAVHRTCDAAQPKPPLSGMYATWAELTRNPVELDVPFHLEGRFGRSGGFEANPSTWLTLRTHPVPIRGPAAPTVWHDPSVLRGWTLNNLKTYWQGWVNHYRRPLSRGAILLDDELIVWGVSGVARLHFTIATDEITSKTGACRYALETFGEQWHPLVGEILALRLGERARRTHRAARRRDAPAFMQMVIDDAARL